MPMGGGSAGFAAFVVVKFAGYTAAGHYLAKAYDSPTPSWKTGAVRTAIGVAVGMTYFTVWNHVRLPYSSYLWFIGLIPVRFAEWGLLLRLSFDKSMLRSARSWKYSLYGTLWSFALDAIGVVAAFVVPGGVWIC